MKIKNARAHHFFNLQRTGKKKKKLCVPPNVTSIQSHIIPDTSILYLSQFHKFSWTALFLQTGFPIKMEGGSCFIRCYNRVFDRHLYNFVVLFSYFNLYLCNSSNSGIHLGYIYIKNQLNLDQEWLIKLTKWRLPCHTILRIYLDLLKQSV